ncbi:MAG: iron export ABC transporter permease subunit FetB [Ezakiella sp.]|nr:iron export ABC transporter permease subunit FetB [Ezakiella sp.]MDD7472077.1 iron export ABC transporter permease subunit FetB [Bacillota bacterium]MDY3924041.1 iron export ABC transporter permease subunit FetB [Ezakiella sp.]
MNVNDISFLNLVYAFIFVGIMVVVFILKKTNLTKTFLYASVRMTLQLILTGYVLSYIFELNNPFMTISVYLVLYTFATFTIFKHSKIKNKKLRYLIAISQFIGATISLFYFLIFVIKIKPWYNPQFFIPIAGMVIGNSMTGLTLSVNTFNSNFINKWEEIECSLMLGATPKNATKTIAQNALENSLIPTLNRMFGMGIIFLPGMMTGQILSGVAPTTAILYQIIIMFATFITTAISTLIFSTNVYKCYFNSRAQILDVFKE